LYTSVIPTLRRLKQEEHEFKATQQYIVSKQNKKHKERKKKDK
jgi:hypothetical protein